MLVCVGSSGLRSIGRPFSSTDSRPSTAAVLVTTTRSATVSPTRTPEGICTSSTITSSPKPGSTATTSTGTPIALARCAARTSEPAVSFPSETSTTRHAASPGREASARPRPSSRFEASLPPRNCRST